MKVLEKAKAMLEKYALCDHCLGRQFALLGHGIENHERGKAIKTLLTMIGHHLALSKDSRGVFLLRLLATNGSFEAAAEILRKMKRRVKEGQKCFLCEDHFKDLPILIDKIMKMLHEYEYDTFLIGIKLPVEAEEREDEFKAEFEAFYSENMKNEFSRVIGKALSKTTGKSVDFMAPNIAVIVNPFTEDIDLQVNSLYIMGRYRKLVRGIPQSKWLCAKCRGKGCPKCNWTGKMYPES
ncbi:MAG: tRNA pseudouridine(54/55) synthase Pus10, partial [Candidatus Bathyarchaeia archaeon]